ncbi:MAG: DUF4113 domain-containing protein [Allosphingosinicella sp.]
MSALDAVNARFGRNLLRPVAVAATPTWGMRRQPPPLLYDARS